jgi:hypothetical protein
VEAFKQRPLPGATSPSGASDDYYSVENQAERLEAARKAREAARQEAAALGEQRRLRKAQIEAATAQRDAARAQEEAAERSRGYYPTPYLWRGHPVYPHRPRPHHRPLPPREPERRAPRRSLPPLGKKAR